MKCSFTLVIGSLLLPAIGYAQSTGVGINTTAPDRPLTIQALSNSAEWLSFKNNAGATKFHFNFNNGGFNLSETGVTGGDYRFFVQPGGNVGIGTGAPGQQLELAGRAAPALLLHSSGNSLVTGGTLQFRESDVTYGWNLRHNNGGSEGGSTNDRLVLERLQGTQGTSTIMTWDQVTGSVGIGTSAPYSQLSNTNLNIIGSDGNGGNPGSLAWSANQRGYAGMFYNAGTTAASNGLAVKVASSDALAALDVSIGSSQTTAGTSLLRVTGAGNVGIGTGTPAQKLDVAGTAQAQQFAYAAPLTRYYTVPFSAFSVTAPSLSAPGYQYIPFLSGTVGGTNPDIAFAGYLTGGTSGQPGYIVAPVNLPQGAIITALSITAVDNDGTSISPQATIQANYVDGNTPSTSASRGYSQVVKLTSESANWQTVTASTNHTVQNDQYMYVVVVRLNQGASSNTAMELFNVRITYTVAQAE